MVYIGSIGENLRIFSITVRIIRKALRLVAIDLTPYNGSRKAQTS
jgi:hypothetical protein